MEPNKLDSAIKKTLENREITPNESAWNRLELLLDNAENKKDKRTKKIWFVAASILTLATFNLFYFYNTTENSTNIPTQVVDSNKAPELNNTNETLVKKQEPKKNQVAHVQPNTSLSISKPNIINNQVSIIKSSKNNQIQNVTIHENNSKTDIDSLLNQAEKKLLDEKINQTKSRVSVNANDLLAEVDTELEPSFREKVITKINKNFQTVKVAIVNRNVKE